MLLIFNMLLKQSPARSKRGVLRGSRLDQFLVQSSLTKTCPLLLHWDVEQLQGELLYLMIILLCPYLSRQKNEDQLLLCHNQNPSKKNVMAENPWIMNRLRHGNSSRKSKGMFTLLMKIQNYLRIWVNKLLKVLKALDMDRSMLHLKNPNLVKLRKVTIPFVDDHHSD